MIAPSWIEEKARNLQTSTNNIAREYCQHLFLSKLYQQEGLEKILFKGGTALRILWNSPRFSEDLDFSGASINHAKIENKIEAALLEIERGGLAVDILESKKTTGGYLGKILFRWAVFSLDIKIEISQRKSSGRSTYEETLVENEFIPSYTLLHLPQKDMIKEKIAALLHRGKPRDYFDLYFILRSRLSFKKVFGRDKTLKQKILNRLDHTELNLSSELKQFLPASYHRLLKNLKSVLLAEIERNLA